MTETPDPSAIRASKASEVTATMPPDIPCALQKELVPQRANKVNPRTFCQAGFPRACSISKRRQSDVQDAVTWQPAKGLRAARRTAHQALRCCFTLQNRISLEMHSELSKPAP